MTLIWQEFQPIALFATTPTGTQRLQPLCQSLNVPIWVSESLSDLDNTQVYSGSLKEHITKIWSSHRALIFCLATGAVVRLIVPLLEHKSIDPAIIVIDEAGKFVINLCGGHQGGGEQLTSAIALLLNATPILTGASSYLQLPAVDLIGNPFGWQRGEGNWTGVAAAISRGEKVEVIQEVGSPLWRNNLPENHPFLWEFPENNPIEEPLNKEASQLGRGVGAACAQRIAFGQITYDFQPKTFYPNASPPGISLPKGDAPANNTPPARIWISFSARKFAPESQIAKVQWHPRVLWVGIGCERGTSQELIAKAITSVCRAYHLAEGAIAGIATIDIKATEVGLVQLCQAKNWPLKTFSAETLHAIEVPNPSEIVNQEVGTPSVAEAAAICAAILPETPAKTDNLSLKNPPILKEDLTKNSPLIKGGEGGSSPNQDITKNSPLIKGDEGESSLSKNYLLVSKQIFKLEEEKGAVTVAIALSPIEYTGREGKLLLIGTGPGDLSQITPASKSAISQADAIIGYSLYIDLIKPLLRPGQIIEPSPITQERQRAKRAIELANFGLTVAVISSGDCGIYGMAGLVLEELRAQGWDGKKPDVEVFPGITALQAAASRVGAPLMHDFCAISLSDLLTPWEVIEKRLIAAASADFVIALYNPKSQTRIEQLNQAQAIFLQYRDGNTPVAIAHSVYRETEKISLTTLDKMQEIPIDMLTVIIIGNQSTRIHENWMITPRGYLGFN
jgi:cobalt-precorrin 5A hydrolase / precorrin-3B C17-methyltransferase